MLGLFFTNPVDTVIFYSSPHLSFSLTVSPPPTLDTDSSWTASPPLAPLGGLSGAGLGCRLLRFLVRATSPIFGADNLQSRLDLTSAWHHLCLAAIALLLHLCMGRDGLRGLEVFPPPRLGRVGGGASLSSFASSGAGWPQRASRTCVAAAPP
jgi:hypothetical protein